MTRRIPITKPCFDASERELILKPLESGWIVQGPYVKNFEDDFARFVGVSNAVATSNCTTALHLALEILGVGPGDKVLVPALTYVASANAVEYVGAEPVFCDVDLATYNMTPSEVDKILSEDKKIKAVMAVSLFGLCADLPGLVKVAGGHGIPVLEDAACGFGATFGGKHCGTFGAIGCFSFHPRKAITTGEGGMLVTNDNAFAGKARILRDHGAALTDHARHVGQASYLLPDFEVRGYNYRMTDLQGALGVAQMQKAEKILAARRKIAACYDAALSASGPLRPPIVPAGYEHGYQAYVGLYTAGQNPAALTDSEILKLHERRNQFMAKLSESGIGVRPGTHSVPGLTYYRKKYGLRPESYRHSWISDRLSVALPLYPDMTDDDVAYVLDALK